VLGQLTGQDEADRGLDLSGRDGGLLVVGSKLGSLSGDALEDVWNGKPKLVLVTIGERECARQCLILDLPLTKEFRMDMARLEIPVSGWTCLRTREEKSQIKMFQMEKL
jgi:hypothetical protein